MNTEKRIAVAVLAAILGVILAMCAVGCAPVLKTWEEPMAYDWQPPECTYDGCNWCCFTLTDIGVPMQNCTLMYCGDDSDSTFYYNSTIQGKTFWYNSTDLGADPSISTSP